MHVPGISVVVPIYNMEKFISSTLKCLAEQDFGDLEVILVDDGSTDRTSDIISKTLKGDARFRLISTVNRGYGHACNLGVAQATGEYLAVYEPDDALAKDFYWKLYTAAKAHPQAEVIRYNGFYNVAPDGERHKLYTWEACYTGKLLDKNTMKRFWRSHPSVYNGIYLADFLRRKQISFCETPGASYQDVPFMISLYYSNPTIYILNDAGYYHALHPGQSVNFVDRKVDAVLKNWSLEYAWIKENRYGEDESFFFYRICMQADSILKKLAAPEAKRKILRELKKYFKKESLNCPVSTFKEWRHYGINFLKTFIKLKLDKR